ncbi:MAG: YicC family protein [Chlorobiaceae bacterium]|nr:YicC family protein [Chlorobiaceae bacterium]MBA4310620.1 YicC family protein [Chlorobiaceae bacterium]
MISSMTGFGKSTKNINGFSIEVESRSVNNRFLEISLKLPSSLVQNEYELKEFIRTKIKRGKIFTNVSIKNLDEEKNSLIVNEEKITETVNALKRIRKIVGSKEKLKLEHILSFKDIITPVQLELDEVKLEILKNTIAESLDNLIKMRNNEGNELAKDFILRLENIENYLTEVQACYESVLIEYRAKLREKVATLIQDLSSFSERLELEIALIADKSDVTEECVRLKSHIKFFRNTIENDSEVGRKLNFICQEMHREANTIASKSISMEVTKFSVLIREEIEKIREQIQNIE